MVSVVKGDKRGEGVLCPAIIVSETKQLGENETSHETKQMLTSDEKELNRELLFFRPD